MNVIQSLENLALIKVGISIYHSSEFLEQREILRKPYDDLDIFSLKQLFQETISNSVFPFRVREKLLGIMKPLILDIEKWNVEKKYFGVHKQLDICLTSAGTIDRIKTFKKFIRSEDQNLVECFALACHFWMTDDVLKMWNKASVDEKIRIERKLLHPKISSYWMFGRLYRRTEEQFQDLETTRCLKKWFDWLHDGSNPYTQHNFLNGSLLIFSYAIPEPNLLRALPPEHLREIIKLKYITNYGREYFSCLDYDLKLNFFQQEPFLVLNNYLKWPLQFKFLEMACLVWEYLTEMDFYLLLCIISDKKILPRIRSDKFESDFIFDSDFDYEGLLDEFWKQSPLHLKLSAKERHNYHVYRRYGILDPSKMAEEKKTPLQRLFDSDPSVAHHKTRKVPDETPPEFFTECVPLQV